MKGSRATGGGRWRIWAAALALLLVMLASATRSQAEPAKLDPFYATASTFAVGDSITHLAYPQLKWDFTVTGWVPNSIAGVNGFRIDQMRPWLQAGVKAMPRLRRVYIYLGTNDADQYRADPRQARLNSAIDQLHAAVHDVIDKRPYSCAYLVTLHSNPSLPRYDHAVSVLNREMLKIADAFARVYYVDWNKKSAGKPWFVDGDTMGHLNTTGAEQLAHTYVNWGKVTAANCPGPPPAAGQ